MQALFQILPKFWWLSLALFILHQFVEKIMHWHLPIVDSYLDPLLSMPIILGIHLAERRVLFDEKKDFILPIFEVIVILVFFALIFEWGLPHWFDGFVYDPLDFVAYAIGALFFIAFINKPSRNKAGLN